MTHANRIRSASAALNLIHNLGQLPKDKITTAESTLLSIKLCALGLSLPDSKTAPNQRYFMIVLDRFVTTGFHGAWRVSVSLPTGTATLKELPKQTGNEYTLILEGNTGHPICCVEKLDRAKPVRFSRRIIGLSHHDKPQLMKRLHELGLI